MWRELSTINADAIEMATETVLPSLTMNDIQTIVQFSAIDHVKQDSKLVEYMMKCNINVEGFKSYVNVMKLFPDMKVTINSSTDETNMFEHVCKVLLTLTSDLLNITYDFKTICDKVSDYRKINELLYIIAHNDRIYDIRTVCKLHSVEYDKFLPLLQTRDYELLGLANHKSYTNLMTAICENGMEDDFNEIELVGNMYTPKRKKLMHIDSFPNIMLTTMFITPSTHVLNVFHQLCRNGMGYYKHSIHQSSTKCLMHLLQSCFNFNVENISTDSLPLLMHHRYPFVHDMSIFLLYMYYHYAMELVNEIPGPNKSRIIGLLGEYIVLLLFGNTDENNIRILECESNLHTYDIKPFQYKHLLPTYNTRFVPCSGESYRCDGYFANNAGLPVSYIEIKSVKELDSEKDIDKFVLDVFTNDCKHGFLISLNQYLKPMLIFAAKVCGVFNLTDIDQYQIHMLQTMDIDNPDIMIKRLVDEYHVLIKNNDLKSDIVKQILDACYDVAMSDTYVPPKLNNRVQTIGTYNVSNEVLNGFTEQLDLINDHLNITFEFVDDGEFTNGFCKSSKIHLIIHHEDNALAQLTHRGDMFILRIDVKFISPELLNTIVNTYWPSTAEWVSNVIHSKFDDIKLSGNSLSPDRYKQTKTVVNKMQTNIKAHLIAYKSYLSSR